MIKRTLAVLACSALLLAGCGGGTTEVERDSAAPLPMPSTPIVSSENIETPPAPDPMETATDPAPEPYEEPSAIIPAAPEEVPVPAPREPSDTTDGAANTPAGSSGSWASMEVTVTTAAEVTKLTGTPPDFQTFIAERLKTAESDGCESEFTILSFHPDGFAAGQEFAPGCGGAQNIWGNVDGQWETLMAMQSVAECTDLAANNIPTGLPDIPCLDDAGDIMDW